MEREILAKHSEIGHQDTRRESPIVNLDLRRHNIQNERRRPDMIRHNIVPLSLAVGLGIVSGVFPVSSRHTASLTVLAAVVTFQPAFEENERRKLREKE